MNALLVGAALATLIAGSAGSAMAASDRHDDANDARSSDSQHAGWGQDRGGDHRWKRGERMGYNDWSSARPVDYRQHHLRQPPHGYEWRESNGQYILAAIETGLIASMVMGR
jgi:Ni/Co efflux regulator RcnB